MDRVNFAIKQKSFRWKPKHLNHIAENIVLKKRNISFLAINALFHEKKYTIQESDFPFKNSWFIAGNPPVQKNDLLRTKNETLYVIFRLDNHNNIIVITAYSENDE